MFCESFNVRVLIPVLTAFCLFINKWIYYCYYWQFKKKNAKHPQDDNHKISHAHCSWSQQSAEDGTLHNHQWLEHFVRYFRTGAGLARTADIEWLVLTHPVQISILQHTPSLLIQWIEVGFQSVLRWETLTLAHGVCSATQLGYQFLPSPLYL